MNRVSDDQVSQRIRSLVGKFTALPLWLQPLVYSQHQKDQTERQMPTMYYSHFCSKNITVFENTLATTVNEFVMINELLKLTML